jgi:hypothetical protein
MDPLCGDVRGLPGWAIGAMVVLASARQTVLVVREALLFLGLNRERKFRRRRTRPGRD